jgi:hypothetical protein
VRVRVEGEEELTGVVHIGIGEGIWTATVVGEVTSDRVFVQECGKDLSECWLLRKANNEMKPRLLFKATSHVLHSLRLCLAYIKIRIANNL